MLKNIINWLLPVTCSICDLSTQQNFCRDCLLELPWLISPCSTCGQEIAVSSNIKQCGECLIDPPPIDRVIVLFQYKFPLPSLITKLKFQKKLLYAYSLGNLLAQHLKQLQLDTQYLLPSCILPVPLHLKRLRQRGYNQAMEIARPIAKLLDIPIDYKSLKRIRETSPQTLVASEDRKRNVKAAFAISTLFTARHVALVDDVVTTYSTLFEIAKVLRQQGVTQIDAWCLAKAHR